MIDTTFNSFTEDLRRRLQEPLPGEAAHQKMASSARYRLGHQTQPANAPVGGADLFLSLPKLDLPAPDSTAAVRRRSCRPDGFSGRPDGAHRRKPDPHGSARSSGRGRYSGVGCKVLGLLTELYIPPSNFYVQPVVGFSPTGPIFTPTPTK